MGSYLIWRDGVDTAIPLKGRHEWALVQLMAAGAKGCTAISNPAPRWSAYVFKLRRAGFNIETFREAHHGKYPGHHARYILRDIVEAQEPQEPQDG
jgi:hypothetical protein